MNLRAKRSTARFFVTFVGITSWLSASMPNSCGQRDMQDADIAAIQRYPVKGLSAEPYREVGLQAGQTLPNDRRYAIENGSSGFHPSAPQWLAKTHFLMLMRNERLAGLRTRFNDASHTLTIHHDGLEVA